MVLLNNEGREIEVVNETNNGKEDLMQDFVSIITSFVARLYGLSICKIIISRFPFSVIRS